MGLQRDYPIKVLSNQKRLYTTNDSNKLNPFFTGFAYAESTFILIKPRSYSNIQWRVKAIVAIGLNKKTFSHIRRF